MEKRLGLKPQDAADSRRAVAWFAKTGYLYTIPAGRWHCA